MCAIVGKEFVIIVETSFSKTELESDRFGEQIANLNRRRKKKCVNLTKLWEKHNSIIMGNSSSSHHEPLDRGGFTRGTYGDVVCVFIFFFFLFYFIDSMHEMSEPYTESFLQDNSIIIFTDNRHQNKF